MRPRRAWIYILSIAALFVPAGGIAYLGAVSYRDERGAVDAQLERQRQAALAITAHLQEAIERALDAVDAGTTAPPLARYPFALDADGSLRTPRPPGLAIHKAVADHVACTSLEECATALRERRSRVVRLHAAQRAEACEGTCTAQLAAAAREYKDLAKSDDTAPDALLGLARVQLRTGDARADTTLAELDRRFAARDLGDLPVPLVTASLRAQSADALLDVADAVLANRYDLDTVVALGVATRLRARLPDPPSVAQRERLAALDTRADAIRADARLAVGLAPDLGEVVRDATRTWRGHPAAREIGRTLIFRTRAGGGVAGIAVDTAMLAAAAGDAGDVALHASAVVLASGETPPADVRVIAQVPLGEALPHLSLALVNPVVDPDPLDEVIRTRSRRHVALTSALAIALGLGLLATIRGAARARELARLKSDFVSTVSHELKTPLTSIRMFAEMLEQGVAKGDAGKMARYHHVIVQESQRLGLLIANLLDYAQIERGTRRYTPSRQPVEEVVRHGVSTYEALHQEVRNPIAVEVSPDAVRAEIEADRDVVVQALLNLVTNAAKYGGPDKPIEIAIGADELAVRIAVTDHGPGIPASEQARIFREFYRAPEAYRSGVEGTGLGLALVKQHVEALGGSVEVRSQVGHGATFTMKLPRVVDV